MYILKLINKPLSDADIAKILGSSVKIIKYLSLIHISEPTRPL